MSQTTKPNQGIHANLIGTLVTSEWNKKYILTIKDAFTKLVELVATTDKEASTQALFERWFCR